MKPIRTITIIGVGFMGGSLALALRRAFPNICINGYARRRSSFVKLSKLGILDNIERDIKKAVSNSDIVVLALPIYAIVDYFKKITPFLKAGTIVFDMGSSKELIEQAAFRYLPKEVSFVGCHPLCGSEKAGAKFAEADLYKGSLCIITSNPSAIATQIVKQLWRKIGAKVIFMPSSKHDRILSSVSHLNHLISFCVTNSVPFEYLEFAPTSLKDLTRISGSPALVWADIFLSNKKNLLQDIKKFTQGLKKFEKLIAGDKKRPLARLIEKINSKHNNLASQQ